MGAEGEGALFPPVLGIVPEAAGLELGNEELTFKNHQELEVTVVAVAPAGARVDADGATGFIDRAKHPSWWDESVAPPEVGDELHVVVLDADREPPRFSALRTDIDIARRLRDTEG